MSGTGTYTAREITPADLPAVARVHLLAFPDGALTLLGAEAVRRYYHWQLTGPHDVVALCIVEGRELTAFCFGGIFRGALQGFLRKNRRYLVWCLATRPWLLANKIVQQQMGAALRLLGGRLSTSPTQKLATAPISSKVPFGVLSIAVHPGKAGTGQGQCLMHCLEQAAHNRRFSGMNLVVSPKNRHAINFYERLGWTRDLEPSGIWSGAMRKDFFLAGMQSPAYPASRSGESVPFPVP